MIELSDLIIFAFIGFAGLIWHAINRKKAMAYQQAKHYVEEQGLQFLDQAILFKGFAKGENLFSPVIKFEFEFSSTPGSRNKGVILIGAKVSSIELEPYKVD